MKRQVSSRAASTYVSMMIAFRCAAPMLPEGWPTIPDRQYPDRQYPDFWRNLSQSRASLAAGKGQKSC